MSVNGGRQFRPELLPRRGEWTAWLLTLAASVGMLVLHQTSYIPVWAWIFWVFLLFSGLSISLGNWMDRHTFIRIDGDGIHYENGLRRVQLRWHDIQTVAILPARFGKAVQVFGEKAHFEFKTLGEVQYRGQVRGRTGFAQGQSITDVILRETGLQLVEEDNNAYYYGHG